MVSPVVTGDTGVTQRTNTFAAVTMLAHAIPVTILDKLATPYKLPKNKGKVVAFRRLDPFTAATSPMVEGVTPTGRKITFTDISVTMKQYGDYSTYTDQVEDFHEDDIGAQISIAHGENAGRTVEALLWGVLRAGTSIFYANGSARTDVNTPITKAKQQAVIRALKNQKAMKHTSILSGSPDFGTTPVEAAFIAVTHTDVEADIRALPGFRPTSEYGTMRTVSEHEIGVVDDVRYILSPDLSPFTDGGGAKAGAAGTMVSTTGTSADVYPVIYMGKEAFHSVSLRGKEAITVLTRKPGTAQEGDPLGQRGSYGWKLYHASKITNEAWIQRLEVAVTAL